MKTQTRRAVFFIKGEKPLRESGKVFLEDGRLRFSGKAREITMPLDGLTASLGGSSRDQIYVTHRIQPRLLILCSEPGLLKDLANAGHQGARASLRQRRRRVMGFSAFGAALLSAALFAAYGLFVDRALLSGFIARHIPPSVEALWGEEIEKALRAEMRFIEDEEAAEAFRSLAAPLLAIAEEETPHEIKLFISEDDQVNAFAAPGGLVVFNRGLLLKAEAAEEVLGVLAHEIAHVAARHSLERALNDLGTAVFLSLVLGDLGSGASVLALGGLHLASLSHSRQNEEEADRLAERYLAEAGIDPSGLAVFFDRLAGEEENASGLPVFLSTHPESEARARALRKSNPARAQTPVNAIDFERLQSILKKGSDSGASPQDAR